MPTTQELFDAALELPLPERLRLAALLLDDSARRVPLSFDYDLLPGYSATWSEEDIRDVSAYSLQFLPDEPAWERFDREEPKIDERSQQ